MSRYFGTLILAGFLVALGCENPAPDKPPGTITGESLRRDADEAVQAAADLSLAAKEKFQQDLEAQLESLDADLATLREKGRDLTDAAKANWQQMMTDLETKRKAAGEQLAKVTQSGQEAWGELQKGAQAAWEDLSKAVQEAARKFE